jgi:glycosyltransferase involved in cell wall biosynthesis
MDTLRVALYNGVVFERDAVSRSLMWKLRLLQRLRTGGCPVEATVFTLGTDYTDESIRVRPNLASLLRDRAFDEADVHIYEYAMAYELFNSLFLLNRPALVVDHNTTPPQLVDDVDSKEACQRAIDQRPNLMQATHVATVGEFTRDELLELGFAPAEVSVLHLPPSNPYVGRSEHTFAAPANPALVRLLYVGRLVRSKGISDLLAAMAVLWEAGERDLHLTIAGSLRFSDPDVIAEIADALLERHEDMRLVVDASDEEVAELFGESDVFVMPSHHEGYCIPVIEAMYSGCFVIGTHAGNIPNVMGGLGGCFEAGDAGGLATAITRFVRRVRAARPSGSALVVPAWRGDMALPEWHAAVAAHLREYSLVHYETGFLRLLERVLRQGGLTPPAWLEDAARSAGKVLEPS